MMLVPAIQKDIKLLLRDRGAVMSLFLLPIVFIAVFGTIFGGGGKGQKIHVTEWHAPGDARAQAIVDAIDHSGLFEIAHARDADAARSAADDKDVVGLIVPAGLDHCAGGPVELVIDAGASAQLRGESEGAIRQVVTTMLCGPAPGGALVAVSAPPGLRQPEPDVTGFQITVPGNAVLFGFFLALTVGLSFVEERRVGTWRRILAAPVNRRVLLLAKLVPFFLVGLIQFAFLFGIGIVVFGMKVAGSPVALVVLTASLVLCATSLGLAMAAIGGSEKQLGGIGSICLLVMGLLGGCMVPRFVMPPAFRVAGLCVPHGWALDGYFDVLVRPGTGLADIAPQIAAVLGFTVVFATFGAMMFRFEK